MEAMTKWTDLTELFVSASNYALLEDDGMASLAKGLSKLSKLKDLTISLNFTEGGPLTSKGLIALANGLPASLTNLLLGLNGNEGITDEGFISLLTALSKLTDLKTITVYLDKSKITDSGLSKLGLLSALKNLTNLCITLTALKENEVSRDEEWKALLKDTNAYVNLIRIVNPWDSPTYEWRY